MSISTQGYISSGIEGNHFVGMGGVPTVILGPGAGAGSFIITGFDNGFTLQVTAGAGTAPNAIVATITFNSSFLVLPHAVFSPGNNNAAASNNRMFINGVTLNSLDLRVINPALSAGTTYIWRFIVLG